MNAETDERRTEGTKRRMSVQISIYWIGGALVLWGGTQVAAQEEGVSPIPLPAPSNQETGPAPIGYDALRQELAGQDFLLEGMRARLFAQDAVAIVVPRDPLDRPRRIGLFQSFRRTRISTSFARFLWSSFCNQNPSQRKGRSYWRRLMSISIC